MSEDRYEEESKEEDVEAHRRKSLTDEPGSDDSDDVEAHRKKGLTDEPNDSDGSDDFELHRKRA